MVQAENKTEHKGPHIEHKSPVHAPQNTFDKIAYMLNNRTLRDITQMLDLYKRNLSAFCITTLTHLIHCYDRTYKHLQTLDLDSQRITQSSQATHFALESMPTLFHCTTLL